MDGVSRRATARVQKIRLLYSVGGVDGHRVRMENSHEVRGRESPSIIFRKIRRVTKMSQDGSCRYLMEWH